MRPVERLARELRAMPAAERRTALADIEVLLREALLVLHDSRTVSSEGRSEGVENAKPGACARRAWSWGQARKGRFFFQRALYEALLRPRAALLLYPEQAALHPEQLSSSESRGAAGSRLWVAVRQGAV